MRARGIIVKIIFVLFSCSFQGVVIMASIQRILGIQELSAESSEDDARRTFDKWAATYEEVCMRWG